jgi:hypothetical protein
MDLLKAETGIIDEDLLGCFLNNFINRDVCSRFNNNGCKNLVHCELFFKVLKENGYV